MALYTLKSRDEAILPLLNYNGNSNWIKGQISSFGGAPTPDQTQLYNAIGRTEGENAGEQNNENFFSKRLKSIENALGTTGSAAVGGINELIVNEDRNGMRKDQKSRMNEIAKQYGYNDYHEVWDARDRAKEANDTKTLDLIDNVINPKLKAQANENAEEMTNFANKYQDYVQNDYIGKKTNQDRGKFAGSALNTLSTTADVMTLGAGIPASVGANVAQGAIEGLADELEQNGGLQSENPLEWFGENGVNWERAGQNAAIGAATGAVTGLVNKGVGNAIAKNGGNLFKGGNKLTNALNNFNSNTALGRAISTVGSGAARGAISGAAGGATGAGLSSAMNNVSLEEGFANALKGAAQGAGQGAITGGAMAGATMAADATINKVAPDLATKIKDNQARNMSYGNSLKDQFRGAWKSGDSAVAENILKPMAASASSKIGEATGKIGTFAQDLTFQNAIKNPSKMKDPVYLGELTEEDVSGVVEAYKNAGIDLMADPDALNAITVNNGKMYLNQENAQHIHDARIDGNGMTPRQVRKVFRNSTGENATVSDELTKSGNATIGAPNGNGYDVSHLYVDENGEIGVRTVYPAKSGTIPKQLKRVSGSSQLPSADISGDEGLPAGASALRDSSAIITQDNQNVNAQALSNWDKLARDGGYENWDALEQRFMEANPDYKPTGSDAGAVLGWMDENPGSFDPNARVAQASAVEETEIAKVPTSKQIKGKRQMVEEITSQFNAVDKPTARATKPNETFSNLYEEWGLSDGDDIRQAVSYAKQGSLIPQMVREAAGEAGVIDLTDAEALVMGLKLNKQASNKVINALENVMDSTDSTIFGGKQGIDALELQRDLQQIASDARGTNGTYRIGNSFVDETMARNFERIANNIGQKLDEAAVQKGVVPNVLNRHAQDIQNMKNAFPDNTKWQEAIDTKILGAKNIGDLRHSMKDLVRANIFINNGDENFSTFGGQYAAKNMAIPTTKAGIQNRLVNDIWDKIRNSKVARNARLNRDVSMMNDENSVKTTAPTTPTTPTELADATTDYSPQTQLYNAIGRTEGNLQQQNTARYLVDAVQEAEIVPTQSPVAPLGATTAVVPDTATAQNSNQTALYNTLTNTPTSNNMMQTTNAINTGYYQPTGDYWTDIIASAMSAAIDADDVKAFASLYGMYQDQLANLQKQASSAQSNSQQKLTSTQQRANAAMNSLERLSGMQPDTAYNLSSIPLIGNIATLGGNDYEAEAKSLAQQIGYMVSGSNIKDSEAENIGKSYVPQPWDNEQVRQSKLRRAREIIQQYQNGYVES